MSFVVNPFALGAPAPNTFNPIFCCGFECGQLGTVGQHWTSAAPVSINTGTVRNGSRSLRCNPAAQSFDVTCIEPSHTVIVARFYVRFATLPNHDTYIASCGSGTARIGVAFKQSDSKLYAAASTSTIAFGASGVSVTTGVWYRIDLKMDQTVGAKTADVQVDGSGIAQKTSTDAGAATAFKLSATVSPTTLSGDWFIDDVLLSATGTDYPIGAGYVNHFVPTADGTHNISAGGNFKRGEAGTNITNSTTDSYLLIDDTPLDDTTPDTLDYISAEATASTNYVENVLGPASGISTPIAGPRAVEVIVCDHQGNTAVGVSTFKLNDNGTEDTVLARNGGGVTTIRYSRKHYANAPSDGNAWRVTTGNGNFNNLRHRFGYSSDASPHQYCDCVMIEAEFA